MACSGQVAEYGHAPRPITDAGACSGRGSGRLARPFREAPDLIEVRSGVGQDAAGRGLGAGHAEQEVPAVDLLGAQADRLTERELERLLWPPGCAGRGRPRRGRCR